MMNIKEYFENILNNEGYEAWENANDELIAIVEDEEADLNAWAEEHKIDLELGKEVLGSFVTYLQMWAWDNLED